MSETYIKINKYYYQDEMVGQIGVLVERSKGLLGDRDLIGFPLDSPFG